MDIDKDRSKQCLRSVNDSCCFVDRTIKADVNLQLTVRAVLTDPMSPGSAGSPRHVSTWVRPAARSETTWSVRV
jgi:hypothetical protein